MLLYKDGVVDLVQSTFHANFAITNSSDADGIGIVNIGGELQCDIPGCLPVCTACLSPQPTQQPTTVQQARPSSPPTDDAAVSNEQSLAESVVSWFQWAVGTAGGLLCGVLAWRLRTRCRKGSSADTIELEQPYLLLDDELASHADSKSVELVSRSVMNSHAHSPAPVFAVCCQTVRITLWSPGTSFVVDDSSVERAAYHRCYHAVIRDGCSSTDGHQPSGFLPLTSTFRERKRRVETAPLFGTDPRRAG